MSASHRLSRSDFQTPTGKTKRLHSESFTLLVSVLGERPPKFGVVVSKKVSLKATERNLIKRRARAALVPLLQRFSPGLHIVILVRKEGAKTTVTGLRSELSASLKGFEK